MIAIDTDVSPVSVTAATINPLPPEEVASLKVSAGVRETCHIWHLLRQCEVGGSEEGAAIFMEMFSSVRHWTDEGPHSPG